MEERVYSKCGLAVHLQKKTFAFLNGVGTAVCRECGDRYAWDFLQNVSKQELQNAYPHHKEVRCVKCNVQLI